MSKKLKAPVSTALAPFNSEPPAQARQATGNEIEGNSNTNSVAQAQAGGDIESVATNSHTADRVGTNYQASGNLSAFNNDIGGNQSHQSGSHNKQVGGNMETFKGNEIEGSRNIQGTGNAFNEIEGNGNHNTQAGRDIGAVAGSDAFYISGDDNTGNIVGHHNTVHNHYHHPAYDQLLLRYLELVDKYTRLLEQQLPCAS